MNPARSLAPALVSGRLDSLWVYLIAPVLGALGGVLVAWCVLGPACCTPAKGEGDVSRDKTDATRSAASAAE